jgi:putative DNA primase/helicase
VSVYERAAPVNGAREITHALGGRWRVRNGLVRCVCHEDKTPSLSIGDGDHGIVVKCFAGCDGADILRELRRRGLLGDSDRRQRPRRPFIKRPVEHKPDPEAVAIWETAHHAAGSVVEKYLLGRGIKILPPTLRVTNAGMIAAVHAPDGKVIAIQTTFLTSDARLASRTLPRITQGALGRGAVRLAAAGEVLGLAEGTETGMSAMQLFDIPTWAVLGANRLDSVAIPPEVKELFIFADNDDAGRAAAERAARAYRFRTVHLRFPPLGNDWNDFLIANRGDAVPDLIHERDYDDDIEF